MTAPADGSRGDSPHNKALPGVEELKIELTDACQANCSFCHQRGERSARGGHLGEAIAREWIDWASSQGIGTVRFTGGEPTLHPALRDLCAHAKSLGMETIVNSNGIYGYSVVHAIASTVDTLKISLPTLDSSACDTLTGVSNSLGRKMETIAHALELGMEVEMLTAMVRENVGHVEAFLDVQEDLVGARWVPLRLESSPDCPRPVERGWLQQLAEEIERAMLARPGRVPRLHLATPFCAVRPIELGARVFSGRADDCGPFHSLTVTSNGSLAACYSCRQPIPRRAGLVELQDEAEVAGLVNLDRLPAPCRACQWVQRCMGGCASPYSTVEFPGGGRLDYLAEPE